MSEALEHTGADLADFAGIADTSSYAELLEVIEDDDPDKLKSHIFPENIRRAVYFCDDIIRLYNKRELDGFEGDKIFFNTSGELVRIREKDGDLYLKNVTENHLQTVLLSFDLWGEKQNKDNSRDPVKKIPHEVVKGALDAGSEILRHIKTVRGTYSGIMLTASGEIITSKGFNPGTRYYHTVEYPKMDIPECPTEEDVKAARDTLWTMFHEFAFNDPAGEDSVDYQNTLAALLTVIFSPTWEHGALPIWVVDKTSSGTGGSLLQDIVARLAMGIKPVKNTAPKLNTEFEKLYQTIAKQGDSFAIIDNLEHETEWVTPVILTATSGTGEVSFRCFGTQDMTVCRNLTFYAVNGVHVNIREDMCRRVFVTRLNPPKACGDMRFSLTKNQLETAALKAHPEIIRCVGILQRFWMQAGEPDPTPCKGNIAEYPEWYRIVCGILQKAGYQNVLTNLLEIQTEDDDSTEEGISFLEEFARVFPNGATPKDLHGRLLEENQCRRTGQSGGTCFMDYASDVVRDRLVKGTLTPEAVGRWLTSKCGQKYRGYGKFLQKADKKARGGRLYFADSIEKQAVINR